MATPGQDGSVVLTDGRVIEYWEGGDPDGVGVILHPGTPSTRVLGVWGHEAAVAAGVRLVSVSRPGYGGSTTLRTASLMAVGNDTGELAAHLGFDGYAVIGISGGAPFAVASAIADTCGVRAVGVVGGIGPWRLLDEPTSDPKERAVLALLDAGDLDGAWEGSRRGWVEEFSSLATPQDAVDLILDGAASPLANDDRYRALWVENMRLVLANLDGAVRDNLAWGGTWDVDLHDVVAPTMLWFGEDDDHCPVAYGQWYADRITRSDLVVIPGAGHLDVVDGHWPEVLAGLRRIWH